MRFYDQGDFQQFGLTKLLDIRRNDEDTHIYYASEWSLQIGTIYCRSQQMSIHAFVCAYASMSLPV
uniref:Acetyltransferase n=1 Tax=Heterorhabditis bacteriophora TaxID=37862 RepID=A0A1I7WCA6_HETBA